MTMGSLKTTLFLTGKLALAGAIICAIGWSFVVYQPDGTVRESEADILDLSFVELSEEARFARGLDELGHDEPQTFDINGNAVNFSINYSSKRPTQLAKEYQEELVYQGLNEKVWPLGTTFGSDPDMAMAAMTGSVVPLKIDDNSAVLGGVMPAGEVNEDNDFIKLLESDNPDDRRIFTGHRVIRMLWDKKKLRSTVTATWGSDEFDYRKMAGVTETSKRKSRSELNVDTEVPSCPGCSRLNRVRDLDPSRNYSSNIFSGPHDKAKSLDFYRKAMVSRGWRETDSSRTFNAARPYIEFQGSDASMVQFAKNARFLTVMGFPGRDGETVIHTTISD
jgi:hypothetical protein